MLLTIMVGSIFFALLHVFAPLMEIDGEQKSKL